MTISSSVVDVLDSVIGIPTSTTTEEPPPFLPSEQFTGSKPNYVFRSGDSGLGYYLDATSEPITKKARIENKNNGEGRSVRFDPTKDETKSIPSRRQHFTGEELLAQAEERAATINPTNKHFDTSPKSIAASASSLNKTHEKNQLLRAQHGDDPEKFMMNELMLNDEILVFKNAAVDVSSYESLVESGVMSTFGRLMEHENSDVSMSVMGVLVELLDVQLMQETTEDESSVDEFQKRGYNMGILADAFLAENGLDAIANNLGRFDESVEEDAKGVDDALSLIESLLDLDRAGVLGQNQKETTSDDNEPNSVVASICKTSLLSWLFHRIEGNDDSDAAANNPISPAVIRLHASEVLATILQHEDYSMKRCGVKLTSLAEYTSLFDEDEKPTTKPNGDKETNVDGMEILLISIAAYRKSDPKVEVECEFLENIFDALAASLLRADNVADFVEKEGIQLMLRCVREKVHSGGGALKVLNFALSGSSAQGENNETYDVYKHACEIFVQAGGLKLLFPLYMARKSSIPCPAACSEGGSDLAKKAMSNKSDVSKRAKRAAHARKKWLAEVEQNAVNIMYALTRYVDEKSKYDSYSRLLAKFVEEECVSSGLC
jgi:beta-catenin-like protein 1